MCSQLLGVLMSNAETTNHCSAPWSNLEIFVFSLKCFVVRATMRTRLPRSPSASWCHQSTTSVFIAVWDTCDRNDEIKQCVDVICLLKVVKYSPQMSILCFWTTSHTITSCWFVVRLLLSIKLCSCRAVCAKTAKQWNCSILPTCSCFWSELLFMRRKLSSSLSTPTIPWVDGR